MPAIYYYNETTSSWEPAVVGEQGATGATGPQGGLGAVGSTGATGIGIDGATGATGLTGATGPAGANVSLGNLEVTGTTIGIANGASESTIVVGSDAGGLLVNPDSSLTVAKLYANSTDSQYFSQSGGDFSSGSWTSGGGGGQIILTGATNVENFFNNLRGSIVSIEINGTDTVPYDGAGYGGGTVNIYTTTAPPVDPTTVTEIVFNTVFQNRIVFDIDEGDYGIFIGDHNFYIQSVRDVRITSNDDFSIESEDGFDLRSRSTTGGIDLITDYGNSQQTWQFRFDGSLTTPGDITVAGDITGTASSSTLVLAAEPNSNTYVQLNDTVDSNINTVANLEIRTDVSNTAKTWTFDTSGNLNVPGNILVSSGASPAPIIDGFSSITTYDGANIAGFVFDQSNLTLPGNSFSINYANGTQVSLSAGATGATGPAGVDGATGATGPAGVDGATGATGSFSGTLTANLDANTYSISNVGNITASGNISAGGLIANGSIKGNPDLVLGNTANANATLTRIVTDTTFSYIQTGNGTVNSTGNIVFSPYSSPTQKVVIDTSSGNLTAAGTVTANNFSGNITITGNVTGTSPNVTLVAGSYSTVFDNTGNIVLPGNTFSVNYANGSAVDPVTKFTGSWTVPAGSSTQSFSVPANASYVMWVRGNIPNGIIVWNARVTLSNTNVPAIGEQYAWYYATGNALVLTSIPNQIIGTNGSISNAAPAVSNTDTFSFGITNNSGGSCTIEYGYIQIG